jgi:hypothetical protein
MSVTVVYLAWKRASMVLRQVEMSEKRVAQVWSSEERKRERKVWRLAWRLACCSGLRNLIRPYKVVLQC